jgi:hypothetical protein
LARKSRRCRIVNGAPKRRDRTWLLAARAGRECFSTACRAALTRGVGSIQEQSQRMNERLLLLIPIPGPHNASLAIHPGWWRWVPSAAAICSQPQYRSGNRRCSPHRLRAVLGARPRSSPPSPGPCTTFRGVHSLGLGALEPEHMGRVIRTVPTAQGQSAAPPSPRSSRHGRRARYALSSRCGGIHPFWLFMSRIGWLTAGGT